MNLGLGNLYTVKANLLADALRAGTRYDGALQLIAAGVATSFERYCNRKFGRVEGDTFICSADRSEVYLPRYPVESVSATDLKVDTATGWETQTDFIWNLNEFTGQVYWGGPAGPDYAQLRFTYTGGYWFDETEENTDTLPAGATALPADLQFAWILQTRAAWQAVDKTGVDIVKTGSSSAFVTGSLGGLELVPQVKQILDAYRRFQIT